MRADRLLSIVLLLDTQGRMTAGELAERLEVSPRTIQRDMEALSGMGIPVIADRGADGGWSLLEPYRTNLNGLNYAEIMALFLNTPQGILADLGVYQASKAALLKLLAALPKYDREYAEWVQESFYLDTSGWGRSANDTSCLTVLQEAICERLKVRLMCGEPDGDAVEKIIDPLGLVSNGQVWFLVASESGEPTTYPIRQILDAQLTDTAFMRPPHFNLAAYWDQKKRVV